MSVFYNNVNQMKAQNAINAQKTQELKNIALARHPKIQRRNSKVVMNNKGKVYNFINEGYNNALKEFGKTSVNGGGLTVGVNNQTHNNHKLNANKMLNLINNRNNLNATNNVMNNVHGNINKAVNNILTAKIEEKTVPKAINVVNEIHKADTQSKLQTVAKKVNKLAVSENVPKYSKAGKYLKDAWNIMKKHSGKRIYTANGQLKQIFENDGKLHYKVQNGKRIIHSSKTKKVKKFNPKKMVPVGKVYNAASGTVKNKYLNKNSGKILLKQSNGTHGNTAHFLYKASLI